MFPLSVVSESDDPMYVPGQRSVKSWRGHDVLRSLSMGICIALGALANGGALADDGPFYCGSKIIDVGMTKAEVLARCGEPTSESFEDREVRDSKSRVLGMTRTDRLKYESYTATRMLVFVDEKLQTIERF
jgi:Protein of unknown function (DUF2845)